MFDVFDARVFPGTHGPVNRVGPIVLGNTGTEEASHVPPALATRDEST
jgi:hypothetical protein